MSEKKIFHFENFEKIEINGNHNIPTCVYKNENELFIGYEAIDKAYELEEINFNFKMDIGKYDPQNFSKDYKNYQTADGKFVSSIRLAELFFNQILDKSNEFIEKNSFPKTKSIMIAEPLSLINNKEINEQWLSLYRKNIKNYFAKKGFENINFLPEPFAVFQYYKYCKKFSALNVKDQIVALVVDFGGGTFDTCIIETTQSGDIKKGGKNSKPLGASSINVGGSNIDIEILNYLLDKENDYDKIELKRAKRAFRKVQFGKAKPKEFTPKVQTFIKIYLRNLLKIQEFKEILSNEITSWSLDNIPEKSVSISLPKNFFQSDSQIVDYQFTAQQFYDLFKKLYKENLYNGINTTLSRGLPEANKNRPDFILLSGGSSKIGWLFNLIRKDFEIIDKATKIDLKNYKEVVSSGLAVECARRFYNKDGDFGDITYNKLILVLNPNKRGLEIPNYKSRDVDISTGLKGLLLPSSSLIRKHFDTPMKWKFRLKNEPKNTLEYYFLKDSFDPQNLKNVQNLDSSISHNVKNFDKHLELELLIREDGTTIPTFKFNSFGQKHSKVKGTPFVIDMTFGDAPSKTNAYMGFDFGTTNSSVSYVCNKHIELYEQLEDNDISALYKSVKDNGPILISYPLAKFVNETNDTAKAKKFINLFENILSLFLYIALIEIKISNPTFKFDFTKFQRAAGSLIYSLKLIKNKITESHLFSSEFLSYIENIELLERGAKFCNDFKHPKMQTFNFDYTKILSPLLKGVDALFSNSKIGMFNNINKVSFVNEYHGHFILAHGNGVFGDRYLYNGQENREKNYCYLYNNETNKALNLFPFLHWETCATHREEDFGHLYIWDKIEDGGMLFSVAKGNCEKKIEKEQTINTVFMNILEKFVNGEKCKLLKYEFINLTKE